MNKSDKPERGIDAWAGLRNDLPVHRFTQADLAEATNVRLDDSAGLSRREGYDTRIAGAAHSLYSDEQLCLYVAGDTLYRLDEQLVATILRTGLTQDAPMHYARYDERLFYVNGYESGCVQGGVARSWGLEVPPAINASDVVGGTLDPGRYQVAMTTIRTDGQESGASETTVVDVSNGAIALSNLPVSLDPDVVEKVIYLSTANGELLYEALVLLAGDTDALIVAAEGHTPMDTPFQCQVPEFAHLIAAHFGKMLVAVDNVVYLSTTYGPELFDPLEHYALEGGRCTLIAPVAGGVFLATTNKTFFLRGTDSDSFALTHMADYGAREGSLVYSPAYLMGFDGGESRVAIWTSGKGVVAGLADGSLYPMSGTRYTLDDPLRRAAGAIHVVNGTHYYACVL